MREDREGRHSVRVKTARGATLCTRDEDEGGYTVCIRTARGTTLCLRMMRGTTCVHKDNGGCYTMHVRTTKYFSFLLHHLCSSSIYLVTLFSPSE